MSDAPRCIERSIVNAWRRKLASQRLRRGADRQRHRLSRIQDPTGTSALPARLLTGGVRSRFRLRALMILLQALVELGASVCDDPGIYAKRHPHAPHLARRPAIAQLLGAVGPAGVERAAKDLLNGPGSSPDGAASPRSVNLPRPSAEIVIRMSRTRCDTARFHRRRSSATISQSSACK